MLEWLRRCGTFTVPMVLPKVTLRRWVRDHESGRLKSVDERRGKFRVRRRFFICLPTFLEPFVAGKTSPIGPSTCARNGPPGYHNMAGFVLVNGVR